MVSWQGVLFYFGVLRRHDDDWTVIRFSIGVVRLVVTVTGILTGSKGLLASFCGGLKAMGLQELGGRRLLALWD